jgi:hypothetical protein
MGKDDEFPRAVVYEGGELLLHSGLPLGGLGVVMYSLGSTHSRADKRATAVGDVPAGVWGGPVIRSGHDGLLEDDLVGFALVMVTSRRDKHRRVFGHVGHKVHVAEEVRPESNVTGGCRRRLWIGRWSGDMVG